MLDRDLASLYGVETRVLNQAVRRNMDRFPDDFVFSLTREEVRNISQIVTCSTVKHSRNVFAPLGDETLDRLVELPEKLERARPRLEKCALVGGLVETRRDAMDTQRVWGIGRAELRVGHGAERATQIGAGVGVRLFAATVLV